MCQNSIVKHNYLCPHLQFSIALLGTSTPKTQLSSKAKLCTSRATSRSLSWRVVQSLKLPLQGLTHGSEGVITVWSSSFSKENTSFRSCAQGAHQPARSQSEGKYWTGAPNACCVAQRALGLLTWGYRRVGESTSISEAPCLDLLLFRRENKLLLRRILCIPSGVSVNTMKKASTHRYVWRRHPLSQQ